MGGAYMPEKLAFYSTFDRQLCNDTSLPGGSLPFQHTHKHSLASFTHTNSQPSHSTSQKEFFQALQVKKKAVT